MKVHQLITKGIDLFFFSLSYSLGFLNLDFQIFAPYSSDVFYCPEATLQNS